MVLPLHAADMPIKRALVIGIDGCRPDALLAAKAPNLHKLIKNGAFSDKAQTGDMTASGSGWGSLLTGVWREKHGVRGNDFKLSNFAEFPDMLARIKKARSESFVASIVHWAPIQQQIVKKADVNVAYKTDPEVTTAAVQLLAEKNPALLFVHLDDVDGAGHRHGFHPKQPKYLEAIEKVDKQVGELLKAVSDRKTYEQEDWLIVVSTDHGGSGKGHGQNTPEHRTIFVIVSGKSAAQGVLEPAPMIVDIVPTVLQHLGIAINPRWNLDGKAVGLKADQPKAEQGPVGHWPLIGDAKDISGNGYHALNRGADLKVDGAIFDGRGAYLEVPTKGKLSFGLGDFSLACWVHTEHALDDVPGDIASLYDLAQRRGFHLTIKSSAVTTSQANARHLQFGIDNNKQSGWSDCGRPGNAILAFALATHEGQLYAGTCEPGKNESGRVYRYAIAKKWIDCGSPDASNSVTALAVHDGKLYAGTGKYRLGGSALKESENLNLGGGIYRYDGASKWTSCGQLPNTEALGGFVVYRGKLYASSLYKPAGFFRYEGETKWTDCGTPAGKRVEALAVYDGFLYASSYDGGRVYRYDGKTWTDCGLLGDNTQTYSFAVHHGKLYVGTWPSGRVYRFEDVNRWKDVGRLGNEKEVMGMIVHNGRLLAGTLPLAEVYQYEADDQWKKLAQLDTTPNVTYRRAWTAAEHQGRVYFSTLPSGHIHSIAMGRSTTWEHEFPAGWHHVAAIKRGESLELYVDGKRVAVSDPFTPALFDLNTDAPLRLGAGANDFLRGKLREVRLYQRALSDVEIGGLARP